MQIDRRITNGLAWAGALLVVAIPAADVAMNQFGAKAAPQVAVVDPVKVADPIGPSLPTPVSQRPKPTAVAAVTPTTTTPVTKPVPVAKPDPVTTASASTRPAPSGGDVVDDFLSSGRPLPSYITGGSTSGTTDVAAIAAPATVTPAATAPAVTTPAPQPQTVAAVTTPRVVGYPTPVSLRPASLPRSQAATQPPLVVETQPPVVTAADLEEWESGPLSEFLASRQGNSGELPAEYDPDGFFLDQGPNPRSNARVLRFPRAYGDGSYSFD